MIQVNDIVRLTSNTNTNTKYRVIRIEGECVIINPVRGHVDTLAHISELVPVESYLLTCTNIRTGKQASRRFKTFDSAYKTMFDRYYRYMGMADDSFGQSTKESCSVVIPSKKVSKSWFIKTITQ